MPKVAGVKSPTELMIDDAVDELFQMKMSYSELVDIEVISEE